MALYDQTLWGDVLPGGDNDQAAPSIDANQVIDDALPTLHAASRADLVFWTVADLLGWLDEGVKRLALLTGVFITRATTLTAPGYASYPSPDRQLSTIHVSIDGVAIRPAGTLELEARDDAYLTTQGTPDHWYQDLTGMDVIALAPVPDAELTLGEVHNSYPATLDLGGVNTLVPAPPPLKAYLALYMLAEAYGREGEAEAQDIAQHCRGRLELYHQVLQIYYGGGN